MSPTTGLVEGTGCPCCGSGLWRNTGGLYYCTNRNCPERWHNYSLEPLPQPPPQPKKEPVLGVTMASAAETLTSSQQCNASLRRVFGYKQNREIYRLRKQLGDINIVEATPCKKSFPTSTSDEVITVIYHPAGGVQRFPLVQHTVEVETNVRLQQVQLGGLRPHMRGPVSDKLSGQTVFAKCYIKDSAGPQASA